MSSKILQQGNPEVKGVEVFVLAPVNRPDSIGSHQESRPPLSKGGESLSVPGNGNDVEVQLSSTHQQAEQLIRQAQNRAAEIEKEAYEKGFHEGEKSGKETGEKMSEAMLRQYSLRLEELALLRKQVLANTDREVVRLALEIAKKVIKREVAVDGELILTMVKVALNRLSEQTAVTIRLNPKDYHTMMAQQSSRSVLGSGNEGIKMMEDPLISRGGCLIETESGIIDSRIEEQLKEIERGLFD